MIKSKRWIMIGIDMVYIPRVEALLKRRGERFLHKLCSPEEYRQLKNRRPEHIAALFAAKEAMGKALGCGIFEVSLQKLSVHYHKNGRPYGVYGNISFDLSIAHEGEYALAIARLDGASKREKRPSAEMAALLPEMNLNDHKGARGKAAIVGGSPGMYGSVDLSTRALLRAGAGLAYAVVAEEAFSDLALRAEEVIVKRRGDLSLLKEMDALGIGPGMGRDEASFELFKRIYSTFEGPMVVDADGLYHLARGVEIRRPEQKIYTPHHAEMARLIDKKTAWVARHREEAVNLFLSRYGGTVVLKGNRTIVANRKERVYNDTGNPGMATAGSGDVLTGIITAWSAQGLNPFDAARLGAYVHGLAGDIGILHKSRYGLIASDLLTYLPEALLKLEVVGMRK